MSNYTKKYIITNGSNGKYLEPINPYTQNDIDFQFSEGIKFNEDNPILFPYVGMRQAGTIITENEFKKIISFSNNIENQIVYKDIELLHKDITHPKILNFADEMQKQISINSILGKTGWEDWNNIKEILVDFEYHKAKLLMALKENNKEALREYIADCANILMFLGNAYDLYSSFSYDKKVFEMVSPLFVEKTIENAVVKNNIKNL